MFLEILPDLTKDRELKPWETNSKDLEVEMKQLGLEKKDLKLNGKSTPLVLDVENNPVDRVYKISDLRKKTNPFLLKLTAKYLETGSYLRPHDMLFCIERTKFSEEKILAWFKTYSFYLNSSVESPPNHLQVQKRMPWWKAD